MAQHCATYHTMVFYYLEWSHGSCITCTQRLRLPHKALNVPGCAAMVGSSLENTNKS